MGFFEILLIAVVALLVVGPERMPEAVRSAALTFGRIKRSFNSARSEIEKQIGADEIRRQLHNEEVMASLGKIKEGLSDIDKSIDSGKTKMPWTEDDYKSHQQSDEEEEENYYDYDPNHHQNPNHHQSHKDNEQAAIDTEPTPVATESIISETISSEAATSEPIISKPIISKPKKIDSEKTCTEENSTGENKPDSSQTVKKTTKKPKSKAKTKTSKD